MRKGVSIMEQARYPLIERDPEVMNGRPVIKGTRLTVELILERLADGYTFEQLLENYPRLTHEGILAVLGYAAGLAHAEAEQAEHATT